MSLTRAETTVGESLKAIVRQDPRYLIVGTGSPYVIDILPADTHSTGEKVLDLQIPHLDIEADEWPENLISQLPDLSPELARCLMTIYNQMGATNRNEGIASSATLSNPAPPHFSLHLTDTSVIEALNAIAASSIEHYLSVDVHSDVVGVEGVRRPLPPEHNFRPTGWKFELVPPGDLAFPVWAQRLFTPL